MAALIYLDTHVAAWLYAEGSACLTDAGRRAIEAADEVRISPIVRLELQYLYEIGRVSRPALPVIDALESALGLAMCDAPFTAVVRAAEAQTWTRDPFDRLIVAQASLFDAPLVTKDGVVHGHYRYAIWE